MAEANETTAPEESTAEVTTETTDSPEQAQPQAGSEKEQGTDGSSEGQAVEYQAFSIPDGYTMDKAEASDLSDFAKEFNLSQEDAQKMVNKHFDYLSKNNVKLEALKSDQLGEWASEATADKEFGGANLSENMNGARKAMNSFSQPAVDANGKPILSSEGANKGQQMTEIEMLMNQSGWGNHPAMIRVFHRINQAMSEDKFVQGDMKPFVKAKSAAETMYPSMK